MQGFFYTVEDRRKASIRTGVKPQVNKAKAGSLVLDVENACEACGLYKGIRSPRMEVTGLGRLNVLYMGEAQGANEDEQGRQFVGDAGQLLRSELAKCGIDFDQDLYALNAVRCFTWRQGKSGKVSRNPTDQEIKYCWKGTWNLVRELRPKAVILAGLVPLQSYLLDKGQDRPTMARWRGWTIPDQELECWIIPNYHPSFVLRNSRNRALVNLFRKDLYNAIADSQKPFRRYNADRLLNLLSQDEAIGLLNKLLQQKVEYFLEIDFETTGLKPHRQGHSITHVGLCFDHAAAWSFRLTEALKPLLHQVLLDPDIPLAAHNIQMEQLWAWKILSAEIPDEKWYWDSMIAAHVLDNRSDITSLEFQAAVRYGDWFFKDATNPYLRCPGSVTEYGIKRRTGGNDFNRIYDCPEEDILRRVCKDALYGYWLSCDQIGEMNQFPTNPMSRGLQISDAYWLFHGGTLAMGRSKISGGLVFDREYFNAKKSEINAEIRLLLARILESQPAKVFKETISNGVDLNPASDDQMRKLLLGVYRIPPLAETDTGVGKVDNEFLTSLVSDPVLGPFCQDVLRYNQLIKLQSTYIAGYEREALTFDGRSPYDPECKDRLLVLYPHLALNLVATYRSSSRNPNFQNIPNRSEFAREMIRGGLLPHPGHRFLSADFGSHEFIIAANYSRDKEMIRYIVEGGDPHGDQADRIFLIPEGQRTKEIRYIGKNGWVFPQQYGSPAAYRDQNGKWRGCAPNMWNMAMSRTLKDGTPLLEHLAAKGIKNLDQFAEHCQAEEEVYWNKFSGLKAWQQEWISRYERDGVVPMYHGFVCQGLMTKNQILNYSIQGTGFHFLLESYIDLLRISEQEGWRSKFIGQIHDEIRLSAHPDEFAYLVQLIEWVMVHALAERHSEFLVVPLKAEFKAAGVDEPWSKEKAFDHKILMG